MDFSVTLVPRNRKVMVFGLGFVLTFGDGNEVLKGLELLFREFKFLVTDGGGDYALANDDLSFHNLSCYYQSILLAFWRL